MTDSYHHFFLHPATTLHRRYEALRAFFVEQRSLKEIAQQFGYSYGRVRNLVHQFRTHYTTQQLSPLFREPRLGRLAHPDTSQHRVRPDQPVPADCRQLSLRSGRSLHTRVAGLFVFLPLLARLQFDHLVTQAAYPGSRMVPATNALLSLLALKLLGNERRSHISDFDFEEALGLFAGLNLMPKKSFATDYSYRTQRHHQVQLLSGWVRALAPFLFPQAQSFSLDFHPAPHRGDASALDNHYIPRRGKAAPSVQTFFAQEQQSRVLCYANANCTRDNQAGALMEFVEFWHHLTGQDPQWLYFDSKLALYPQLAQVNERGIKFVTIRRRGAALLRRLQTLPAKQWREAVIDIPKRHHHRIRYLDEILSLRRGYKAPLRQVAVKGLGREHPTLFLSNSFDVTPQDLITRYARRNHIEDSLGTSVNFFHLDCLASEVRLNVDLDVVLTVLANSCYRWLATQLHGFDKAKPKYLSRKFIETAGVVAVESDRVVVRFEKRSHNPILREAALDKDCPPVPWLSNLPVVFEYP